MHIVDLRSDTVTRPSQEMKEAMMRAPLGDDVLGDDPTVKLLEARAAALSGKQAAVFVPSGTMGNQIAIRLHTRPGEQVLMEEGAHPFNYEAAGAAAIAGVQICPLPGQAGVLAVDTVRAALPPDDPHFAPATLLCVEDTANRGGGTVYPLDRLDALAKLAHRAGLRTHMDGARAFHAVVDSGHSLARRAQGYDTLTFCLSKGLGAPVGSVLCGSADDMHTARRVRKMLGGGMRQSGMLAAAGLYALEHNVERLADDHRRARRLGEAWMSLGYDAQIPATNILFVGTAGPAQNTVDQLHEAGVWCLATGPKRLRMVLHLDVDDAGVRQAIAAIEGLDRAPTS